MTLRVPVVLVTAAAAFAAPAGAAHASDSSFGRHVSECAQMTLGQRDGAPVVTCGHEGMEMTFPNFGAMVQHMQEMH